MYQVKITKIQFHYDISFTIQEAQHSPLIPLIQLNQTHGPKTWLKIINKNVYFSIFVTCDIIRYLTPILVFPSLHIPAGGYIIISGNQNLNFYTGTMKSISPLFSVSTAKFPLFNFSHKLSSVKFVAPRQRNSPAMQKPSSKSAKTLSVTPTSYAITTTTASASPKKVESIILFCFVYSFASYVKLKRKVD